jgi:hypothetical protein
MQTLYVIFFVLASAFGFASAIRPDDEILLPEFNQTFYIANETYVFSLVPQFQVPLQVLRHVIYTATSDVITQSLKRAFLQNKGKLYDLAPEDHERLSTYMKSDLPSYLKVNKKKRSLPPNAVGYQTIPLARNVVVFHMPPDANPSKRRDIHQADNAAPVELGTSLCLHVPFFTTCDNSQDLSTVKNALQAQEDAFNTEMDSYEQTNDARANEMAVTLDQQRDLIVELAQESSTTLGFIISLAS